MFAMPVCASSSAKVVASDGGIGRRGTPLFHMCGEGVQSSYGSDICFSDLWVIVSAMEFGSVRVILPNSMIALLVSWSIASARFLSHKPWLGWGMMSNRLLILGKIGSPVSWSSSSSSSRSILKRRDGSVFSSLLLLISMSLKGEPGLAMLDIGESGDSLFLLEAALARVQSAVNMLVGCECKRQVE